MPPSYDKPRNFNTIYLDINGGGIIEHLRILSSMLLQNIQ